MYFKQSEHNPPHIQAIYNEHAAAIDFITGDVLDGYLPQKELALVREWLRSNANELQEIWQTQEFRKLSPLK